MRSIINFLAWQVIVPVSWAVDTFLDGLMILGIALLCLVALTGMGFGAFWFIKAVI